MGTRNDPQDLEAFDRAESINSQWERETLWRKLWLSLCRIEVLIPNGNAKLEHFVFLDTMYHNMAFLSMMKYQKWLK